MTKYTQHPEEHGWMEIKGRKVVASPNFSVTLVSVSKCNVSCSDSARDYVGIFHDNKRNAGAGGAPLVDSNHRPRPVNCNQRGRLFYKMAGF